MTSYTRGYNLKVLGLLVGAALVLFTAAFVHMTNRSLTQQRAVLFVRVPTAEGLKKGDAVLHRGVQVGAVRAIRFSKDAGVLIEAKLTQDVPLMSDATAALIAADVFGRQTLVLKGGNGSLTPLRSGDTIQGRPPASMAASFEDIGQRVQRVIGDTTTLLLHNTLAAVARLANEMTRMTGESRSLLAREANQLHLVSANAAHALANVAAATDPARVEPVETRLVSISARLDSAMSSLQTVLSRVEGGEGSAGRLLADTTLYARAAGSLDALEELLRDIRANPKRYINVKVF